MGCCGKSRAAATPPRTADARQSRTSAAPLSAVQLRSVAGRGVRVRGTATGRVYEFPRAGARATVDRGDVGAMLRTGYFVRT